MTGGPTPVAGSNPFTGNYQVKQFDTTWPPHESVLDALANPPAAGINAEATPDVVFNERDHPPVGAGGNTGDGSQIGIG